MRISIVSYLNSAPLVHGIRHSEALKGNPVKLEVPSAGARALINGEADIALVPVGAFTEPGTVRWVGSYCIGVEGPVRTVRLFSEVPPDQITRVLLDPHSRTSVQLVRLLARLHWKTAWQFIGAENGFEERDIRGTTAGICIGDKVFGIESRYPYSLDLAAEWMEFTGLPFVFAAWAVRSDIDPGFVRQLDLAQEEGIKAIPGVARDWSDKIGLPEPEIRDYLTRNISYPFTPEKKAGMEKFLSLIRNRS